MFKYVNKIAYLYLANEFAGSLVGTFFSWTEGCVLRLLEKPGVPDRAFQAAFWGERPVLRCYITYPVNTARPKHQSVLSVFTSSISYWALAGFM